MTPTIVIRNVDLDKSTRHYIEDKFSFAFKRLRHAIHSAVVTVNDLNGPTKGGVDIQCRVLIKPVGLPSIVISERQSRIRSAIDASLGRASRCLVRKLRSRKQLFRHTSYR
ncbi:MAG TPA: hypothetical protein DD979_01795 [Gammaproteobacteria bacterium]|jgi:ribosome-associated translation inhibitor RaiA|nr:hypothetical protein [Gammaproteobacteria bacterium]